MPVQLNKEQYNMYWHKMFGYGAPQWAPRIQPRYITMLSDMLPNSRIRWNRLYNQWCITIEPEYSVPYIYRMVGMCPDFRIFNELREDLWWAGRNKQRSIRLNSIAERTRERARAKKDDNIRQASKELGAPLRSLARAGNSDHGDSTFLFPGFGESKLNVKDN